MLKNILNTLQLKTGNRLLIIGDNMEQLDDLKHRLKPRHGSRQGFEVITALAVDHIEPRWTTNRFGKLNHTSVIRERHQQQDGSVPHVGNTDYVVSSAAEVKALVSHLSPDFLLTNKRLNRTVSQIQTGEAVVAAANEAKPGIPKAILDVKSRDYMPPATHQNFNLARALGRGAPERPAVVRDVDEARRYFGGTRATGR